MFVDLFDLFCSWFTYVHMYVCLYLPQAVSFPPLFGIDRDLSQHNHLSEEGELEPALVGCSVAAPFFSAALLQPRQVHAQAGARLGLSAEGSTETASTCQQSQASEIGTQQTRR